MTTIQADLYRFNGKNGLAALISTAIRKRPFRYVLYYRWANSGKCSALARLFLRKLSYGLNTEIGRDSSIGDGLVLIHPGAIAVNSDVVIGKNCTIYHGVTVGIEFRGKRKGCPTIGDNVWFGPNSTVVGQVTLGDDILLSPGSFVNFDVPSHSIVIGNPGRIVPRNNATDGYITRPI